MIPSVFKDAFQVLHFTLNLPLERMVVNMKGKNSLRNLGVKVIIIIIIIININFMQ